jgi:hypothetical protein
LCFFKSLKLKIEALFPNHLRMLKSPRPPRIKEEVSDDLAELLKKQKQVQDWQQQVQKRIGRLEEIYLKESTMGNIIRGFDQDASISSGGRDRNRHKENKEAEEREKMFSGSSYTVHVGRQNAIAVRQESKSGGTSLSTLGGTNLGHMQKKTRKE